MLAYHIQIAKKQKQKKKTKKKTKIDKEKILKEPKEKKILPIEGKHKNYIRHLTKNHATKRVEGNI